MSGRRCTTVRAAVPGDWDELRRLLDAADLPVSDLGPGNLGRFFVAEAESAAGVDTAGFAGVEPLGEHGLLRSLVVDEAQRGSGTGEMLVGAVESAARGFGIREMWLLTIDADGYFVSLGYRQSNRDEAPEAVRATREFSELCPGDAVLMHKTIGDGP